MANSEEDEILLEFLTESREHLRDIETDLLALEQAGDDLDSELVNKVFRAVHSIKGAAGFFELVRIQELSHAMETLLEHFRKRRVVPNGDNIDLLLKGADLLLEMLNKVDQSNGMEVGPLAMALLACTPGSKPTQMRPPKLDIADSSGRVLFQVETGTCELAAGANFGGDFFYLARFDMIRDIDGKGKTPYGLFEELESLCYLLDSKIDSEAVGTLESPTYELPLHLLIASVMEPDLMVHFLELNPDQVSVLPKKFWKEPLGSPIRARSCAQASETAQALQEQPLPGPADPSPQEAVAEQVAINQGEASSKVQSASARDGQARKERKSSADTSIRVHTELVDRLMVLAGELVLSRNALVRNAALRSWDQVDRVTQKINLITSELQDAILSTRMQPLSQVFGKFKRIVRDLAGQLQKKINLELEGEDVELDSTIIQAIGDPLTHLIRNACDHGIESPARRLAAGKPEEGRLLLRARHEAGLVVIEIIDDGGGIHTQRVREKALSMNLLSQEELAALSEAQIHKLIFKPGFSTAGQITEVSGRGVGMDVVHTNLTKLGGTVDIDSVFGVGCTFRIKLPLTLAIIPSLLVACQDQVFAIPQVNLQELVRIPPAEVKTRIERVGDAAVMRLRGELLYLIRLSEVLGIEAPGYFSGTGERHEDRRRNLADRRTGEDVEGKRSGRERRLAAKSALNLVVVQAAELRFGLVVDEFMDSAEIVVKPLGRHFLNCGIYAGATILSDGQVACILDIEGIARGFALDEASLRAAASRRSKLMDDEQQGELEALLLVRNGGREVFSLPLGLVRRIEKVRSDMVEFIGGRRVMKYRGGSLPLFAIEDLVNVSSKPSREWLKVIVFPMGEHEVGLIVDEVQDIVHLRLEMDTHTHRQPGVWGSAIIQDAITLFLDLHGLVRTLAPEFSRQIHVESAKRILVVDDSPFMLGQMSAFLREVGFQVRTAADGEQGLQALNEYPFDLVFTDLEMPRMNGFEFVRAIRQQPRFAQLPVLAVTSLGDVEARQKGLGLGLDDYLIKLDRECLLQKAEHYLRMGRAAAKQVG